MQLDDAKARLRAASFAEIENTPLWYNPGRNTATLAMIVTAEGEDQWQLAFWHASSVVHE